MYQVLAASYPSVSVVEDAYLLNCSLNYHEVINGVIGVQHCKMNINKSILKVHSFISSWIGILVHLTIQIYSSSFIIEAINFAYSLLSSTFFSLYFHCWSTEEESIILVSKLWSILSLYRSLFLFVTVNLLLFVFFVNVFFLVLLHFRKSSLPHGSYFSPY